MKAIIDKRLAVYKNQLKNGNLSNEKIIKLKILIDELESILDEKFYEDSLEFIDVRKIDISNSKDVETLLRNNKMDILENEETIVSKLSEGLNFGLYRKNKLIGYILGRYDYEKELYSNEDILLKVSTLNSNDIFIISDLLIDKKSRKNGHATFLIQTILKECNCDLILAIGRNQSNGINWRLKFTFLNLGFEELLKHANFWLEASIVEDYECLSCHYNCNCEMELLYLKRDGILSCKTSFLDTLLNCC